MNSTLKIKKRVPGVSGTFVTPHGTRKIQHLRQIAEVCQLPLLSVYPNRIQPQVCEPQPLWCTQHKEKLTLYSDGGVRNERNEVVGNVLTHPRKVQPLPAGLLSRYWSV